MPLLIKKRDAEPTGSRMDKTTVYTKTAKGITQVNQKSASLSKDLMKVLKLIDGKSNFGQIMEKAEMDNATLSKAFTALQTGGFARVFQTQKKDDDPFAGDAGGGGGDDFDFTAPGKMPASTQRVMPGAANDISELVRQQEKADAARKAATQAQDAARVKATQEAQVRAKLEAEAKAKAEAERHAMEQAQRAKEAAERAKAELDSKMREEAARKAAAAAQSAKLTSEQKAKEEEEQRRLAEVRVRAEKEAKALAEARARAEAEAAALAKARAEAEAAAKKQAAEATNAEAQLKQKLKEEIEQRIRGEMEELMRTEGAEKEEKSREEMRAQIMEEAKLAAKAELEERLQAEREAIHKVELEARSKAEAEANANAAREAKLRAEAEARAAAATAAALKAEEDAKRAMAQAQAVKAQAEAEAKRIREQAEIDAKRLREAEARARAESEGAAAKIEAERRAKYEAEARAKIEQEEAEKRRRELEATIEAERKATAEAEARARIEAKARETVAADTRAAVQAEIESDMAKRAEIEGKAKAKAYMEEKAKAEQEEEEKLRADQARRAKEMAELLRSKMDTKGAEEGDEVAPTKKKRPKRRKPIFKTLLVMGALALIAAVGLVHVVPIHGFAVKVEAALSKWLHDDVSIGSAKFWLVPSPHLLVENITVGKLLDAKAAKGRIYIDPMTIFGDKLSINQLEFESVTVGAEAVKRMPTWGNPEGKSEIGSVNSISLKNVKLEVKPAVDAFNADLSFDKKGQLRSARLAGPTWTVSMKPGEGDSGIDLDVDLRNFVLPSNPPVAVSSATLKGKWTGNQIVVPEFDGTAMDGKVSGTLRVSWGPGVHLESDLALARMSAKELVATFTKDIAVTGRLDGNFQVTADGNAADTLFASPRAQGKFRIVDGSVSNVDLVAVMQSDAAGSRAGVTKFGELTGEYAGAEHRATYRNLNLQGGVLRGAGSIEIGQSSALSGHATLEIRSQVAQDRGSFGVTGTVSRPIIRRGG
jgi:hypothetical protein